jgi:hypothetical protein
MYAIRRTRLGAAITGGGWVLMAIGFALGPFGGQLIMPDDLTVLQPLALFCLGWVGLIVGLQLHRRLPSLLPPAVQKITLLDAVLSVAVIGGAAWAAIGGLTGGWWNALPPSMLLAIASIGWSPETRSLRTSSSLSSAAALVQACGGLSGITAVLAYGLFIASLQLNGEGEPDTLVFSATRMGVGVGIAVLTGLTMGLLGKWLMTLAGRDAGEFLIVLLGLVTFTAGAAVVMGYSPLFAALLTGIVVVNLPGPALEKFKRVIMDAEQPMAMTLMALAGLLLDPFIGWSGLMLLLVLVIVRISLKQMAIRPMLRRIGEITTPSTALAGMLRQSPIAIPLGLGFAISPFGRTGEGLADGPQLLAVLVAVALISDVWALMQATRGRAASSTTGGEEATR